MMAFLRANGAVDRLLALSFILLLSCRQENPNAFKLIDAIINLFAVLDLISLHNSTSSIEMSFPTTASLPTTDQEFINGMDKQNQKCWYRYNLNSHP